jgi:hypothetical protein
MLNYFFKNSNTLFLTCALAFISIANAQEVRVIDNKGTIKKINNNQVTTATTAPTDPLEGDIWVPTIGTPKIINVWDGSSWIYDRRHIFSIGEVVNGGVVFWVDSTGQHGLVVTFSNVVEGPRGWGCYGTNLPNVPDVPHNALNPVGLGAEIGDGFNNTNDILRDCPNAPAALAARNVGDQWFLPSIKELNQMYINKSTLEAIPGFTAFGNHFYWSSSDYSSNSAWGQFLNSGSWTDLNKSYANRVRAVRAF